MREIKIGAEVEIQVGRRTCKGIVQGKTPMGSYLVKTFCSEKTIVAQRMLRVCQAKPIPPVSLLGIALKMLQERGVATAGELARQIVGEGLWKPTKGGKTPRLTLYSLLYLDSKKKAPHVRKLEGGK